MINVFVYMQQGLSCETFC